MDKQFRTCNRSPRTVCGPAVTAPITITYMQRTTTLLRVDDAAFLTDPHFGRQAHIFEAAGALNPAAVLISSPVPCDIDPASFRYIASSVPVIVPEGGSRQLRSHIRNPIIELHHWSTQALPDGSEITAIPAEQQGVRSFFWRGATNGYIIRKKELSLLFSGKTIPAEYFAEINRLTPLCAAIVDGDEVELEGIEADAIIPLGAKRGFLKQGETVSLQPRQRPS